MNEEIYEGTPAKEDVLIGTDSGYNRYRRPDGSTYVHYPYSRMATVTAYSAKDKNGQPIRTADGKLITGKTQAEADRNRFRYDMNHWVEANRRKTAHLPEGWRERIVTPDMNTFNAITGGVFNLTPIQVGRGIHNLSQGKDPGFILGNSGVVSKEYAQEHPWLALGANVLGEGLVGGFIYGAPKLYNNIKSIHKHLNTPYKSISINGQALNLSKQLLINKGIKHPTLPKQVVNITKENASQITDLQWDEAFNDALEKGKVEKLKELRDLHFQVKSGNDTQVFAHSTSNSFNEFDQQFFGKTDEGFNGKGFYFSTTRIPENPAIFKIAKGPHGEIPYMNYGPKKKYFYLKGNREFNVGNPNRNFFEESNTVGFVGPENATVSEVIVGKPSQIKSARTLTYDDEGILIPLSKRDNFSINDFRYKYGGKLIKRRNIKNN